MREGTLHKLKGTAAGATRRQGYAARCGHGDDWAMYLFWCHSVPRTSRISRQSWAILAIR